MALQPATRRLLTEAAAATVYRTAAQIDTQADNRVAAMLTTQKGKPSGLASLGADGLVPTAQLPPSAGPRYKAAELTIGTALVPDPDLVFVLAVGRYVLDGVQLAQATAATAALTGTASFSGGLVLGANSRLGLITQGVARTSQVAATGATFGPGAGFGSDATSHGTTASAVPARLAGYLDVTTAGTLQISWAVNSGSVWLQPGSWSTLLKVA